MTLHNNYAHARMSSHTVAAIALALAMGVDRPSALAFRTLEEVERVARARGEAGDLGASRSLRCLVNL